MSHTRTRRTNQKRTLASHPVCRSCRRVDVSPVLRTTSLTCYGCGRPVCTRHNATRAIPHAVLLCADCESAGMPILLCAC